MHYTIAIGSDHRGFELKKIILEHKELASHTISWIDEGTFTTERADYPIYAKKVVDAILSKRADVGILLCGSGVGVAVAANRYPGIYAGVAWNETVARAAKEDDNCNVLVLPADYSDSEQAIKIIAAWLSATFKGGRYQERIEMIDGH
jgi:ribose 5-phosphate isomerase B